MKKEFVWGSGLSPFFVPEDFLPSRPTLPERSEAEVVVIGGGLSGLLCTYRLLKQGKQVTLVCADTVGDGASRYSSGIVSGDGGPELSRLREILGQQAAVDWYRRAVGATDLLEKTVSDIGSKCDFLRRDLFYYTAFEKDVDALREECFLRHHIGIDCQWRSADACFEDFSFPCKGGILQREGGAQLNLVRFCKDLSDWILLHGGTVFEGSRIDLIEAVSSSQYRCHCGTKTITSSLVVDTRGGEVLSKRPSLGQRVTVFSVVTEPVDRFRGWQDRCLLKSRDQFLFLRTTADDRILLCGGASGTLSPDGRVGMFDAEALRRVKYRNLEEDLREMFIGIPDLRRAYGFSQGIVIPKRGLPFYGKDPLWDGLYYLYAFGESGIASAVLGSECIGRMIADPSQRAPEPVTL